MSDQVTFFTHQYRIHTWTDQLRYHRRSTWRRETPPIYSQRL